MSYFKDQARHTLTGRLNIFVHTGATTPDRALPRLAGETTRINPLPLFEPPKKWLLPNRIPEVSNETLPKDSDLPSAYPSKSQKEQQIWHLPGSLFSFLTTSPFLGSWAGWGAPWP